MTDKQTQLAWLDKQRSVVNDMIVNLPPDEQKQLLPELQVINAIAERVKDMTAVEYLEVRREMCKAHLHDCRLCPFSARGQICWRKEDFEPHVAVEIVRKWKEEQDGH